VLRTANGRSITAISPGITTRGLAYWSDGTDERILYITPGFRLVALDARTGRRMPGFGDDGRIDLKAAAGAEVGALYMPAQQSGSPMTSMVEGAQYIVVAISGGVYSGEYRAFKLP